MYRLKASATFDSAHFLAGYQGKCANLHGHTWRVEAEITGTRLQSTGEKRGMLLDFGDLKKAVRSLADVYDHALLYEAGTLQEKTEEALKAEGFRLIVLPFRPTAECFAARFFEDLKNMQLPITKVTVWETQDNRATYEEEDHG